MKKLFLSLMVSISFLVAAEEYGLMQSLLDRQTALAIAINTYIEDRGSVPPSITVLKNANYLPLAYVGTNPFDKDALSFSISNYQIRIDSNVESDTRKTDQVLYYINSVQNRDLDRRSVQEGGKLVSYYALSAKAATNLNLSSYLSYATFKGDIEPNLYQSVAAGAFWFSSTYEDMYQVKLYNGSTWGNLEKSNKNLDSVNGTFVNLNTLQLLKSSWKFTDVDVNTIQKAITCFINGTTYNPNKDRCEAYTSNACDSLIFRTATGYCDLGDDSACSSVGGMWNGSICQKVTSQAYYSSIFTGTICNGYGATGVVSFSAFGQKYVYADSGVYYFDFRTNTVVSDIFIVGGGGAGAPVHSGYGLSGEKSCLENMCAEAGNGGTIGHGGNGGSGGGGANNGNGGGGGGGVGGTGGNYGGRHGCMGRGGSNGSDGFGCGAGAGSGGDYSGLTSIEGVYPKNAGGSSSGWCAMGGSGWGAGGGGDGNIDTWDGGGGGGSGYLLKTSSKILSGIVKITVGGGGIGSGVTYHCNTGDTLISNTTCLHQTFDYFTPSCQSGFVHDGKGRCAKAPTCTSKSMSVSPYYPTPYYGGNNGVCYSDVGLYCKTYGVSYDGLYTCFNYQFGCDDSSYNLRTDTDVCEKFNYSCSNGKRYGLSESPTNSDSADLYNRITNKDDKLTAIVSTITKNDYNTNDNNGAMCAAVQFTTLTQPIYSPDYTIGGDIKSGF